MWIVYPKNYYYTFTKNVYSVFNIDLNNVNIDDFVNVCKFGYMQCVKYLLLIGIDPSANQNTGFINACGNGHLDIVELLINDIRVDPTALDNSALIDACREGYFDIVKVLLQDGRVDPTVDDNVAFIIACGKGRLNIVKLLMEYGVDPYTNNNDAIVVACRFKRWDIVELFLKDKYEQMDEEITVEDLMRNIDAVNLFGLQLSSKEYMNMFIKACKLGNIDIVQLFIRDGKCDPSANGNLALITAYKNGHFDIIRLLVKDTRVFQYDE